MESSGPWWATPLFTLGGIVLTLFVSGRRSTQVEWAKKKQGDYAAFLTACAQLRDVRVWPAERGGAPADIAGMLARIGENKLNAVLVAHRSVGRSLAAVEESALAFAAVVERIRRESAPGPEGAVDARQREPYDAARAALSAAMNAFVGKARPDINVHTSYEPPF